MITYNYDLDLVPGRVPLTIHVSQYDSGSRAIVFSLFSSTGEFVIPAEATAEGVSIFKHDPKGKVACAYHCFTKEVTGL